MALNGLIGMGVPQDLATHSIAHELTALHGIDHARTLAIVLPSLLTYKRDTKREKLLQYAQRVWRITQGDDEEQITEAITRTRSFFGFMNVPTRLSDYGLGSDTIPAIVEHLEMRGSITWGERKDIGLEDIKEILALSI